MEVFLVGGMVRDTVLGRADKSSDCDYVVVGSSPQEMLSMGFTQVGASFPVFLDAKGEEYALARTERKTGVGYHGFEVAYDSSVTLEDDLLRRDLTINSMAMRLDTKEIIDPYGGKQDLADRVIRHTSEAFAEDPVRVLRAARFAARFNFTIHPDTLALMERVAPELIHVPNERIVKEFQKSIDDSAFSKMCYWLTVVNVHKLAPLTNYCIEDVDALGDKQPGNVYWTVLLRDIVASGMTPSYISSSHIKHASLCYKFYDLLSEYSALSPAEKLSIHLTLKTKKSMDQVEAIADTAMRIFGTSTDMLNIQADADVLRNIDMAKAFSQRPPHIPPDEWMTSVQTSALARG